MTEPAYDAELLETRLRWMSAGTTYFEAQLGALADDDLAGRSLLAGWSRAHVASHIARNADALSNLLDWARTGVEHRMYESSSHRAQDIASGSTRSPQEIRTDAIDRARNLASEASEMTERDWAAPVRTARDRPIAAAEVPFMRVREVWVHYVDLGAV
ncbi:MAG: maleylpyruvate isomerase N-terminal domain-containing protein, partial [Acidimicrobiales bacterium]